MSELGSERKSNTITLDGVKVTLFDIINMPNNFINILGARLTKRINLTIRESNRCSTDLVISYLQNGIDFFIGALTRIADDGSTGDGLFYDKWLYFTELSDESSRSVLLNAYLTKNIYPCFRFKGEIVIVDTDNTYRYLNGFKASIANETPLGNVTYLTPEDSLRISCIRDLLYNKDGNPNNIEFSVYRRSEHYYVLYHMCNVLGININSIVGEDSAPIRVRATITPIINRTPDMPADGPVAEDHPDMEDGPAYHFDDDPFVEVPHETVERLADESYLDENTTTQAYSITGHPTTPTDADNIINEARSIAIHLFNDVSIEALGTILGIVDSNRERIENEFRRSIFTIFQETLMDRQDIPEIAALLPHFRNHESGAETNN